MNSEQTAKLNPAVPFDCFELFSVVAYKFDGHIVFMQNFQTFGAAVHYIERIANGRNLIEEYIPHSDSIRYYIEGMVDYYDIVFSLFQYNRNEKLFTDEDNFYWAKPEEEKMFQMGELRNQAKRFAF